MPVTQLSCVPALQPIGQYVFCGEGGAQSSEKGLDGQSGFTGRIRLATNCCVIGTFIRTAHQRLLTGNVLFDDVSCSN
jgi:hypothetical protein